MPSFQILRVILVLILDQNRVTVFIHLAAAPRQRTHSKNQFQRELYLTRRAGFTRWKACVGDTAKSRTADNVTWLAEVRVVEEVEELRPELHPHPLAHLGVLDHRKIRVIEPGADDHIAPQIAEARDRCK